MELRRCGFDFLGQIGLGYSAKATSGGDDADNKYGDGDEG